ncbi:ACT domain-containing protein [Wukongibacter baidiensis]|uniref:ACT domain-containing protein n=1 Tax=Wukongibacter baidiensis TaxID=1723361 RepID=UPI003D7FB9E3
MKAVITVIGKDKIGIIAEITSVLAENKVNILDISQTILQDYFTMIMIVELEKTDISFTMLREKLNDAGGKIGMSVKIQHEDIFNAMHKI